MRDVTFPPAPRARLRSESGTALIMAILASLLLLVFAISFSVLANLEARIGINDFEARKAQFVAEAGFEAVRNHLRPVPSRPNGYTNVLGNTYTCTAAGVCTCTTGDVPVRPAAAACAVFLNLNSLRGGVPTGTFTVRVDNDVEDTGGFNADTNSQVILTSLGTSATSQARAMVRVKTLIDDPWKHVCSSTGSCEQYQGDNPCTPQGVSITPCKREDPHGPKTFPALPSPTTIDIAPTTDGRYGCILDSATQTGWAQRYRDENAGVVLNVTPIPVIGNATKSQSYFDQALNIDGAALGAAGLILPSHFGRNHRRYCEAGAAGCNPGDPALGDANLDPNTLGCGVVVDGDLTNGNSLKHYTTNAAVNGDPITLYVTGTFRVGNRTHMLGTVVVHGNNLPTPDIDVDLSPDFCLNRFSNGNNCGVAKTATNGCVALTEGCFQEAPEAPGYPLAMLVFHPGAGAGTAPPGENTLAKISNVGVSISGIVFSAGRIEFSPVSIDGGVLAYYVEFQGSTQVQYNITYGAAAPPPGFETPAGSTSADLMLSTWLDCQQAGAIPTTGTIPPDCN